MANLSDFINSGGTQKHQTFASSGTWVHPNPGEVIAVFVSEIWAGGGGGAKSSNGAQGGGASGASSLLINATEDLTINIGAGGSGKGGNFGGSGNDGGRSEILDFNNNVLIGATPGKGGESNTTGRGSGGKGTIWDGFGDSPWAKTGSDDSPAFGGTAGREEGGDGSFSFNGGSGGIGAGGGGTADGNSGGPGGNGFVSLFWKE